MATSSYAYAAYGNRAPYLGQVMQTRDCRKVQLPGGVTLDICVGPESEPLSNIWARWWNGQTLGISNKLLTIGAVGAFLLRGRS